MNQILKLFCLKEIGKFRFVIFVFCSYLFIQSVSAQLTIDENKSLKSAKLNRERGLSMLREIKDVIKEQYYDPNFHGVNLDEKFKTASEQIKMMDANWQIFRVIAQVLVDFNDSHTLFYPPVRADRIEYGFSLQMIGQDCFVVDVKKGSDAETKGLKVGDLVLEINGYDPTRKNLWKMMYVLHHLDPQENLALAVKNLDDGNREITIESKFKTLEERRNEKEKRETENRETPYKCQEINSDLIACKFYTFSVDKSAVDKMMKEVGPHKKLIMDLRGNKGGYIDTEMYLTGYFFNRDVKIGDEVTRKKTKERFAKGRKEKAFGGDLIVLIDSESASAAEVFSRTIQIEKRGKIVGDVSAGAVMMSRFYLTNERRRDPGYETFSFYGVSITVGDLIMSDGKRLEGVGVIPDILIGPTGKTLADKTDLVLAYAASLFGVNVTAEKAGEFYLIAQKTKDDKHESEDIYK